ncbi:ATP-binding protein [Alishewanella longhuensis]
MSYSHLTNFLGKAPTFNRIRYFAILSGFGFIANLLSVNVPFVIPFLIGNVVFITLQLRFGISWAFIALLLVMLPVSTALFWFIALAQLVIVAVLSLQRKLNIYLTFFTFSPVSIILLWLYAPEALVPDWQHFLFAATIIIVLFALNLRASQFLLALSASTLIQKQQHLQQQLSQRIALYSAIPGALFIALILHSAIVLHLASKVEYYTINQIQRDAELTSLLNRYQGVLALAAQMLTISDPKAVLTELTKQQPEFISALKTDKHGLVTTFFKAGLEDKQLTGINVSHRYYFSYPAATGKAVITDSFQGAKLGDDKLFALSHPLFSQDEFTGVIEVSVALERLQGVLAPSTKPFEQRLLIDKEGLKIWGSNSIHAIGDNVNTEQQVSKPGHFLLLGHFIDTIETMKFSPSYQELVVERHNALTGWLHQDRISTTAFSLHYHVFLLLAMLLSLFMLEFIAWASGRFARSYTKSLEQIASYAANWSAEDASPQMPPRLIGSSIEFETVLNNLYQLQQRVIDSHHQLSTLLALRTELNTELENRVSSRTEELKNERDKAQHLANVKSRFLANMSHEIRTPITVIKGFSEQLLESKDLAEHHSFSQLIYNNTLHLQRVIDDILDSSKIDEGKLTLVNEIFNLEQFLESLWQSIQPLANSKGITLTLRYELAPNLMLEADPFRLRQIMHNLLSNAIKFTAQGEVQINAVAANTQVMLSVIDQGIGLSETQKSQLFQAFQQADSSTSRKYGGTGLGLYISRHLANLMDMTLEVESKLGIGSVFSLSIPNAKISFADKAHLNLTVTNTYSNCTLLQGHILIVDDVADIRALLLHMLKDSGLTCESAENGLEAIRLATTKPFDLILMDQQMPEMDGITAAEQLRKAGFNQPIIRLSADVYDMQHTKLVAGLFDATLTKPIAKEALKQALQQFLSPLNTQNIKISKSSEEVDEELEILKKEYKETLVQKVSELKQLFANAQYEQLNGLHKIGTVPLFTALSNAASQCEHA